MLDRLHKILARAGVAALRPAEDMILQGRVTVNGRVVRELGARADPETDVIAVDGQLIHVPAVSEPHRYLLLHKPPDVISTAHDTHDRPTVLQLVPGDVRVFPVGRLDADSEGLMLLTDDGDLAYRLTHPRFEVDKEYRVLVDHTPDLDTLRRWRAGVELPTGDITARAWAEVLERGPDGTWLRVVLHEGRKRQIREVARVLGLHVQRLIRVREGPITLGDVPPGAWRELTRAEVEALRAHTQHVPSREADEERERRMSDDEERRPRRLRVIRRPARGDVSRMPEAQGEDLGAHMAPAAWEPEDESEQAAPESGGGGTAWDPVDESEETTPHGASGGTAWGRSDRVPDEQSTGRSDRAPADGPRRFGSDRESRPSGRDYPRRDDRQSAGPPRGTDDDRRGFGRRPRPESEQRGPGDRRDDRGGLGQRPPQREDRRGGFGQRDDRRDFGQRDDRRGFGQRNERGGNFGQRDDRRGDFGQRDDRRGGSGQRNPEWRDDRRGFGDRGPERRDDRPQFRQGPPNDRGRSFDRGQSGGPRDNERGGSFRQDDRGFSGRGGPPRNDTRGGTSRGGFRDGPQSQGFRGGPSREGFRGGPPRDRQPDRWGNEQRRFDNEGRGYERRDDAPERGNERDPGDRPHGFGDRPRASGDRSRDFGGRRSFGGGPRTGQGRDFGRRPADSSRGPDGLPRREVQRQQGGGPPRDPDEGRRSPNEGNSFDRPRSASGERGGFDRRRSGPPGGRPFNARSSGPGRGGPTRGGKPGPTRRPGPPRRRRDD